MLDNESNKLEIIDVREQEEADIVRIKNSKLIPMGELMDRLDEIDWTKKVIFVCRSGSRSGYMAQMIEQIGKKVVNLEGGIFQLEMDNCDCLEKYGE